jgi:hypothetical protein
VSRAEGAAWIGGRRLGRVARIAFNNGTGTEPYLAAFGSLPGGRAPAEFAAVACLVAAVCDVACLVTAGRFDRRRSRNAATSAGTARRWLAKIGGAS